MTKEKVKVTKERVNRLYLLLIVVSWLGWQVIVSKPAPTPQAKPSGIERARERAPWEPITSNYRIPEELVRIIPEDPYGASLCPSCEERRKRESSKN